MVLGLRGRECFGWTDWGLEATRPGNPQRRVRTPAAVNVCWPYPRPRPRPHAVVRQTGQQENNAAVPFPSVDLIFVQSSGFGSLINLAQRTT